VFEGKREGGVISDKKKDNTGLHWRMQKKGRKKSPIRQNERRSAGTGCQFLPGNALKEKEKKTFRQGFTRGIHPKGSGREKGGEKQLSHRQMGK